MRNSISTVLDVTKRYCGKQENGLLINPEPFASKIPNSVYLCAKLITMKNLVEELKWRGLYHDSMPGTEEQLLKEVTTAYIGFDPTADSLHIGSMVQIILLLHLKNFGHKPIALVGGATGMIGDPSGKSDERNLLTEEQLAKNVAGIKSVLSRFLDFNSTEANAPIMVNNYDWMKSFSFIDFAREVGKRITVNYMMAKDSVKKRLSGEAGDGMSFTEFTYQLIQGYDFYHLHKHYNCVLQMGGSDQWGNITTGTELVRRMNPNPETSGAKAFALTTPLITKADGSKFGKSEGGNIWLDADKTSVYKFYQFWLNTSDEDSEKYIKIFTFLDKDIIDALIAEHKEAAHLRVLQRRLAQEVTILVHGKAELDKAIQASNILFGNATADDLKTLDEATFLEVFDGVPQAEISRDVISEGINIVDVLNEKSGFLKSNGEARRALAENSISVNKEKVTEEFQLTSKDLINNQFVLLQRGKKNYFVIRVK
jgi:tyrosyl-tRNA synthetase